MGSESRMTKTKNIRFGDLDLKILSDVARWEGVPQAVLLRSLLRRRARELGILPSVVDPRKVGKGTLGS